MLFMLPLFYCHSGLSGMAEESVFNLNPYLHGGA